MYHIYNTPKVYAGQSNWSVVFSTIILLDSGYTATKNISMVRPKSRNLIFPMSLPMWTLHSSGYEMEKSTSLRAQDTGDLAAHLVVYKWTLDTPGIYLCGEGFPTISMRYSNGRTAGHISSKETNTTLTTMQECSSWRIMRTLIPEM